MQSKTTFFQIILHFIQIGFHFILINIYAPINIFTSYFYIFKPNLYLSDSNFGFNTSKNNEKESFLFLIILICSILYYL